MTRSHCPVRQPSAAFDEQLQKYSGAHNNAARGSENKSSCPKPDCCLCSCHVPTACRCQGVRVSGHAAQNLWEHGHELRDAIDELGAQVAAPCGNRAAAAPTPCRGPCHCRLLRCTEFNLRESDEPSTPGATHRGSTSLRPSTVGLDATAVACPAAAPAAATAAAPAAAMVAAGIVAHAIAGTVAGGDGATASAARAISAPIS